jgi:Na+-translocating ferredoxin:NAD+ oxidoreductase RnfG subunit
MFATLKANIVLVIAAIFASLLGVIKVMSSNAKAKDSQVEHLKASILTNVEVNTNNAKVAEVKENVKKSVDVVSAMPDDDVTISLLNNYTRSGDNKD